MHKVERQLVEYSGPAKLIVTAATLAWRIGVPIALRLAPLIFIGAVAAIIAITWAVATYVNPFVSSRISWFVRDIIVVAGMLGFVSLVAMIGIWGERKVSGRIQSRLGPMRTGAWHGWLQSLADGLKFVQKEDLIPRDSDHILFRMAPHMALVPALAAYAAIPFSKDWFFRNSSVSLLFVLAMLGAEVLGVILAGWASNSKWSLYGAMREACQLVSYEIPMGLSLLVAVMAVGSVNLVDFGSAQTGGWFGWLMFRNPFLFVAFFTYYTASLAACKRAPFDLPEGESELVAGFHTEYSGFRFVMFFFAEYMAMFAVSALATIIFLGGWNPPIASGASSPLWFAAKAGFLVWVQMWVRWTLPRIRIDQVMHTCVKYLLPLVMVLFLAGSVWELFDQPGYPMFVQFANAIRVLLGGLGLVLVLMYVLWMGYGLVNRISLVGKLARKPLPGA